MELGERHELGGMKTVWEDDPVPEVRGVVGDKVGGGEAGGGKSHGVGNSAFCMRA